MFSMSYILTQPNQWGFRHPATRSTRQHQCLELERLEPRNAPASISLVALPAAQSLALTGVMSTVRTALPSGIASGATPAIGTNQLSLSGGFGTLAAGIPT